MDDQKQSPVLDDYSLADPGQHEHKKPKQQPLNTARLDEEKSNVTPDLQVAQGSYTPQYTGKYARFLSQRRLVVIVPLLILAVLGAVVGYRFWSIQRDVTAFQVGKPQLTTEFIGGGGIITPLQQRDITYPAPERAASVLVKAGDPVRAGQALIKLDPGQFNLQLTQAFDTLTAAQNYLNSVSGAFPYSALAVAAAQHAVQLAQARYNALLAQTSSQTVQNGNLISPIKGTVTQINVHSGDSFAANVILITVADQSSVIVNAKIPLANLNQVHSGMTASITPSALPNLTLQGMVTSIIPVADAQTDTFSVWVQVANPQQMLLSGMSAYIRIQSQVNAFVVPRLAVTNPGQEDAVFVIQNGHAYIKPVHVIGNTENSIYIDSGLTPNESIVLLPMNKLLQDGQIVNVTGTEH
jgi:RND family efflux transporter MFP subunit